VPQQHWNIYAISNEELRHRLQVSPPGTPAGNALLPHMAMKEGMAEPCGMACAVYCDTRQSVDSNEELEKRSAPPIMGMATPRCTGFTNPGWYV
jgi:hypothetical protein